MHDRRNGKGFKKVMAFVLSKGQLRKVYIYGIIMSGMSANNDGWNPASMNNMFTREESDKVVENFRKMKFKLGLEHIARMHYEKCDTRTVCLIDEQRRVLTSLMHNYNPGFISDLKHYTKKSTLKLMVEYIKTYF